LAICLFVVLGWHWLIRCGDFARMQLSRARNWVAWSLNSCRRNSKSELE